jgi:murein DD-endopeptidase MepM/ murein hydrolase activator NlpD
VGLCVVGILGLRSSGAQREHNRALEAQLDGLRQEIELAEGGLERVQSYDAKIRALTRADEGVRPFGIGPLEDLEVLALQRQQQATLPDDSALRVGDDLGRRVEELSTAIDAEEVSLQEVRGYLVDREALLGAYPTIWPSDGWVTSHYGFRRSPLPGAQTFHTGIDIAAPYGTPVRAAADGVVISSAHREAYGYTVEIDHGFGMGTLYAHCSRLMVVEGDLVQRGDVIASIGSTGRATGPHLHYEVQRDGVPVNPGHYMIGTLEPAEFE